MSSLNEYTDGCEIKVDDLAPEIKQLVDASAQARERAYAPYSKFQVGAALLAENKKIFLGCNVESSSYGASICAERTAVVSAVVDGVKKFKAIAVIASSSIDFTTPCGICRQFLIEFGDIPVFCVKYDSSCVRVYKLSTLLPQYFLF